MIFSQSIFEQIRESGQKYGQSGVEIGGEILESGEVLMVENISDSPTNTYEIAARSWGVAAHWHTHPNVPDFSGADIEYAKAMALPEIMYCPRYDVMKIYDPASDSIEQIYFPATRSAFQLTESHQQKILEFVEQYGYSGEEIAGIITPDGDVRMLSNTAGERSNHFQIDWGDTPVAAVWHTHLAQHPPKLSDEDISSSNRTGYPYIMYHVGEGVWDVCYPSSSSYFDVGSNAIAPVSPTFPTLNLGNLSAELTQLSQQLYQQKIALAETQLAIGNEALFQLQDELDYQKSVTIDNRENLKVLETRNKLIVETNRTELEQELKLFALKYGK